MSDCLFCQILAKQIPSESVYEDEDVYAFLDIRPTNPGHTLVIPKKHSEGFHDADPAVLQKLIIAIQKIAHGIVIGLNVEGYNILQNNGSVAGQIVPHLHFHIIPRHADDGLKQWPGKPYGSEEEAGEVAKRIRSLLV